MFVHEMFKPFFFFLIKTLKLFGDSQLQNVCVRVHCVFVKAPTHPFQTSASQDVCCVKDYLLRHFSTVKIKKDSSWEHTGSSQSQIALHTESPLAWPKTKRKEPPTPRCLLQLVCVCTCVSVCVYLSSLPAWYKPLAQTSGHSQVASGQCFFFSYLYLLLLSMNTDAHVHTHTRTVSPSLTHTQRHRNICTYKRNFPHKHTNNPSVPKLHKENGGRKQRKKKT